MKRYTKLPKLLLVFGSLLATSCTAGGGSNNPADYKETLNPVTIHSLKEGLLHMNREKNFTLDIYANKSLYYSIYYSDKYIGSDSEGAKYMNMFVEDSNGIFTLGSTNESVVSGEYITTETGGRVKNLYEANLYPVFFDVATEFVNEFDASVNETDISSKMWKINFIEAIGFTTTSYVSLDKVHATYNDEDHTITFETTFNNGLYKYVVVANNFGSTTNKHYQNFMKSNGKAFVPSTELSKFRELLRSDNFARMTYDFDQAGYISMEYFHEHYFYTKYFSSDTYYGYMSMNHKKTSETDSDLCGCYYFSVDQAGPHFQTKPFSQTPDIPEFMHYPKYLALLNNLQYLSSGSRKDVTYTLSKASRYVVYDEKLIKDFAKNFSLNQTWDLDKVPPYALAIEIDVKDTDISKNSIVFHYLMKYNGQNYDYPIPITNFGKSDNPTLDNIYKTYND